MAQLWTQLPFLSPHCPNLTLFFSCRDHCKDMEDRERGQDYFLCLLPGVALPWVGANLQLRPQRSWQPFIPTAAAHIAHGMRGNSTWGLQAGFAALEEPVTEESGVTCFNYTGYLSPRPGDRQAPSWWISALTQMH